jgi:hypothetical protein
MLDEEGIFRIPTPCILRSILLSCFCVQAIGAVNTIVRRKADDKLIGYNTDCEGAITAIEDGLKGNML